MFWVEGSWRGWGELQGWVERQRSPPSPASPYIRHIPFLVDPDLLLQPAHAADQAGLPVHTKLGAVGFRGRGDGNLTVRVLLAADTGVAPCNQFSPGPGDRGLHADRRVQVSSFWSGITSPALTGLTSWIGEPGRPLRRGGTR